MTTNHRREAEIHRELAGQVIGHEGAMEHLGLAQFHALLAIHDTLTAADRYAANEAKQREEAEPEWPEGFDGPRESRDWGLLTRAEKQVVIERWLADQKLTAAEREAKAEKARADFAAAVAAANAAREAAGGDLSASEGESGTEEEGDADDAAEPLWCPKCGHHSDDHHSSGCVTRCDCDLAPSDIARALIEQAVKQAGGRRG